MSLEVRKLDSIEKANENQWNHVVQQSEQGSVYHRYEWLRAVEAGTPYEPKHLVVFKKNNPIGLFPHFVVEIRSDPVPIRRLTSIKPGGGGPVVISDEREAMELLLEAVPNLGGKSLFSLVQTNHPSYVRYHDIFDEHGYEQSRGYCYFTLDLTKGWDEILADMHSSRRRAIKRGHDRDFEVVDEDITPETMSKFYDGFASVMERVDGDNLPESFFRELAEFPERVKVLTLRVDGDERGMLSFTLDDEQSTLHYESSAVEEEHFEYNSSELLHEHAIRWGIENGYENYNFGGTSPDFRDGVFGFKEKFGAQARPALAWERGCSELAWPAFKLGRSLYRQYTSDE